MLAVDRTSAPSPAPAIRLSPSARVASISARWLIDLSPGSVSSPRSRAADRTRAASAATLHTGRRSVLREPVAADRRGGRAVERGFVPPPDVLVDGDDLGHHGPELVERELLLGVR